MESHQGRRFHHVGKPVERADAWDKVTGAAIFGADFHLSGMLYGRVLRSAYPHARIARIDCSHALRLPEVKAVVTAQDLPAEAEMALGVLQGHLSMSLKHLRRRVLAHEKALFDGQAVAAVAATTPEAAEEGMEVIQVEYEPLPVVENALEAMASGAPLLHDDLRTQIPGKEPGPPSNIALYRHLERGDVEQGLKEAEVVVERIGETAMAHQGYLEPHACVARWAPGGAVTVWTCTSGIFAVQQELAALLGIPSARIRVVPTEVGGAFGGKGRVYLEPLAVLLARKTGRPVKMVMTRGEVLRATGPTPPTTCRVRVGASGDGRLTGCHIKAVFDGGAFPLPPVSGAFLSGFAPYKLDHLKAEAYDVVTNKPWVQGCRAPGALQVAFAVETAIDELAERLRIDPLEFRLVNAVGEGDKMPDGQPYGRIGLKELLKRVATHPSWTSPLEGPNKGRGLAVGFWRGSCRTSSALVTVHRDGSVVITSGQVDVAGSRTVMRQMVAEELQLPLDQVAINIVDTGSAPYTDNTGGSRTTYTMSVALQRACASVLEQMKRVAAGLLSVPVGQVCYRQQEFATKETRGHAPSWSKVAAESVRLGDGPVVGLGTVTDLPPAPGFAAHVAEVEVDPETGKVRLVGYTCFQDVGCAVNPLQVEGQLHGGATQGIGWALFEQYRYDGGVLHNANLLDYRMPTALDLPELTSVIVEIPTPDGPYGARGVGEPSIVPAAAAIANAIYQATGVRMHQLPMDPERVFWSIRRVRRGQSVDSIQL